MGPSQAPAPRRRYQMAARADAAAATRERILAAARELFFQAPSFDDVSLEQIAERAGVALKTVQRRFGSKDALLVECAQGEREERAVTPGDIAGITRVLAGRYEEQMDVVLRYLAAEPRVEAVAQVFEAARLGHWQWLEQAFAPHLPARRGQLRQQRVAELFAATEVYVWHSWRRRLGLSRELCQRALREMLEALVARWQAPSAKKD
jgi:AcrR family transcriptional regulator